MAAANIASASSPVVYSFGVSAAAIAGLLLLLALGRYAGAQGLKLLLELDEPLGLRGQQGVVDFGGARSPSASSNSSSNNNSTSNNYSGGRGGGGTALPIEACRSPPSR